MKCLKKNIVLVIEKILRIYYPDAVVMIRLTPSRDAIGMLKDYHTPTILVHADICEYHSPPVLANIVPDQESIRRYLTDEECIKQLVGSPCWPRRNVVVVTMRQEKKKKGTRGTIRNQRISLILEALRPAHPRVVEVDDYGFRHAMPVFEKYPDAFYVCLSDQIAVGIKHILKAAGEADYEQRVLGFDNSALAQQEHVPSFDQGLTEIGSKVSDLLSGFFGQDLQQPRRWPKFQAANVKVRLKYNKPPRKSLQKAAAMRTMSSPNSQRKRSRHHRTKVGKQCRAQT